MDVLPLAILFELCFFFFQFLIEAGLSVPIVELGVVFARQEALLVFVEEKSVVFVAELARSRKKVVLPEFD